MTLNNIGIIYFVFIIKIIIFAKNFNQLLTKIFKL